MSIQITTLDSGLRVASEFMPNIETVALGVWFDVGTRNELPKQNGIAHLLEHMLFKGTSRRTALQISEEIENVGGHTNAYTSRDLTAYYARVMHQDTELAIDLLADLIQNSTFDATELEREKQVIIQEINLSRDTPDDIIFDYMQMAAYGNQPLGMSILGKPEVIAKISGADLKKYAGIHYCAPKTVIAVAGRVDHAQLLDWVKKYFGQLSPVSDAPIPPSVYKPENILINKDSEQAHLSLALPACGGKDPDYYAYSIYATLLGGGSSSRLFQEVREKRGLAYTVSAFLSNVDDTGLLGIYVGTAPGEVAKLAEVLREQLVDSSRNIKKAELDRAKQQLKAGMLMALEQPFSRAENTAQHLLTFGRVLSVAELIEKIDNVTPADIHRIVGKMISAKPALAGIGPKKSMKVWEKFELT
ncbi:MAG: insulinase family protein [Alphaproteobacteria bacterium]|nr:MAG: insulinase family protein [Alphaproteobacteria bacterium]